MMDFAQCAPSSSRFKGNYLRRLADLEKSLILDGWNSPTKEAAHSFIPRIVDRNHSLSVQKLTAMFYTRTWSRDWMRWDTTSKGCGINLYQLMQYALVKDLRSCA